MMRNFRLIGCFAALLISCVCSSCVDNEFDIAQTSGEITLASGETELPLGYLPDKKLGDLLTTSSIENLVVAPNGDYSLAFAGEEQQFNIDGMQTSFSIPQTTTQILIDYPDFTITEQEAVIHEDFNIGAMMGGSALPNVSISIPAGHQISGKKEGELNYDLSFSVPKQVERIRKIYLKPDNASVPGASIRVVFTLNSLASVNGGGTVSVRLEAPQGYELYGEDLKLLSGNTYEINNRPFAAGEREVEFCAYIRSVENTSTIENGKLTLPSALKYSVSYTMTTAAGTVTLSDAPSLIIDSHLRYDDAEIELLSVDLNQVGTPIGKTISVTNIAKEVKSVKGVNFTDETIFCAFIGGLDWFPKSVTDKVFVEMVMPEYFEFESVRPGLYDPATRCLRATLTDLQRTSTNKGVELRLRSITFDGVGKVPENGNLELGFTIDAKAGIERGTRVLVSEILYNKDIRLEAGIDRTELHIESISGNIDYTYNESLSLNLGDLSDIGLDIARLDVSPVLRFTLNNEFTIPVWASVLLKPMTGSTVHTEKVLELKDIEIKQGVMENGVPKSVATNIIIARPERAEEFSSPEITFVGCDLSRIFDGSVPQKIDVEMSVKTNPELLYTFYTAPKFTESYSYSVDIPLTFGEELDLTYSDEVNGLNETFADLAEYNLRVGEVELIAEIGNSSPLELLLDAELIDKNGNRTKDIQLDIDPSAAKIAGSKDGKTAQVSTVKIAIKRSGNNTSLAPLAKVDGIRFTLHAKSAATSAVALNAEQTISARVTLKVDGGVGVDLKDFLATQTDDVE